MNKEIIRDQEKDMYRGERIHVLQYPGIREFFILCCIGADAFTLFSVFDLLTTSNMGITLVITITIAAAMNIIPMLLAACLWNQTFSRKMRKGLCAMLIALFAVLFITTFGLRFTSRGRLFESTVGLDDLIVQLPVETTVSDGTASITDGQEATTMDQDIIAVILGLEPLATSAIAFYLSCEASPYRKRRHIRELCRIALREEIDSVRMMLKELDEDMAFDQEAYDDTRFSMMATLIKNLAEQDELKARKILAEAEGTPEAVGYIMEGGWKYDIQDESGKTFLPVLGGMDGSEEEDSGSCIA